MSASGFLGQGTFSKDPEEILDSNMLAIVHNFFACLTFSLSANPNERGQGMMSVP